MINNYSNIELLFDIFFVDNYLSCSKMYNHSKERYIFIKEKRELSNRMHYSKKIKTFWENIISGAFIKRMNSLIEEENDRDKLLESLIACMKDNILEYDNYFSENDPHFCDINKNHMFYYLTGKKCEDYLIELINNDKFMSECKSIVTHTLNDNVKKTILCFHNIYLLIQNHNVGFEKYYNEKNVFLAYLIPKSVTINNKIYGLSSMIGVGSYGCVCKYVYCKKSVCLKIYFRNSNESKMLTMINSNEELKNIIIDSYYLDKYSLRIENTIIGMNEYYDKGERNTHYLIMECGEHIDVQSMKKNVDINNVIKIMNDIIEKICRLLKFGIYFTDLKLQNMVLNKNGELRFIDLDSFYYLGKKGDAFFSYADIVYELIPMVNGKIHISADNIFMLEKIMIRKLSLIFMELVGFNVYSIKKDEIPDIWSKYIKENISLYPITSDEVTTIENMMSYNINNIPNLENIYNIFLKLKN
jgi:hypothetical protein